MSLFQIIAVLFGLFMLYVIGVHRRKAHIGVVEMSFWYTTWVFFVVIALFPNLLLGISDVLAFSRVFDLLVVIAFMVISSLAIMNYLRVGRLEQTVENLVREMSIKNATKRPSKEK